ncbi:type IV conjugative transfer system lipoprotein TraV [Pectobacterium brasiliense]|uniref:type IV conjugative transfer system lipoprotein TraV n=1 Tax=Pectobacterium brasiliense TaxID=180957 RepID=UPI001968FC3E|nr:type IV conjugative transfer system lipoprotein TraV [Pectobacterium brasiliense]MBN3262960.1 type IV conjugative transfer system lipoprotein TraV [Pectobacterium brasiliense]
MHKIMGAVFVCGILSGCAGMNSDFDCNKTATDQCLSMTEANKLAAKGKSLDDLGVEQSVKKPAGETLPALRNVAPIVNTNRSVSVASTGSQAVRTVSPHPIYSAPTSGELASLAKVTASERKTNSASPSPSVGEGRVTAQRIPDVTQRLWVAPWVDTDDNFHQPAVIEFVKNKSRWEEDFKVIRDGN